MPTECHILIALDPRAPSPSGQLEVPGQAERPFSGWLGLLSALGDAVDRHAELSGADRDAPDSRKP